VDGGDKRSQADRLFDRVRLYAPHWGAWLMGGIMNFRLSTPRRETFLVSIVIAALVVIGMIVPLPFFTGYALGLLLIAYLILLAGVLVDNL
jgi:hypothetical protein